QQYRQELEAVERTRAHVLQLRSLARVLGEYPRLVGIEVLVDPVREGHARTHRLAKLARLVVVTRLGGDSTHRVAEPGHVLRVAQLAVEVSGDEIRSAAGDVHVLADQIAVDSHP